MLARADCPAGSMLAWLRDVEGEILGHLRARFPDVPSDARLRFRPLGLDVSHPIVVAETAGEPRRRLLLKGPRTFASSHIQRAEAEHRVLAEVAPRVAAANASLRCPDVLAYYPDRHVLVLQMVEGVNLRSLLFGPARLPHGVDVPRLLELCGEWLARFHLLTRSDEDGDPLGWLTETLDAPPWRDIFIRCADRGTYQRLQALLLALRREYPGFRAPRCAIHGAFVPYHVLVDGERIYVIDFEGSRRGFAYEDLGFFAAYYDIAPPWRRVGMGRRPPAPTQQRIFADAYASFAGPLRDPEPALVRVARLLAIARFVAHLGNPARPTSLRRRLLGSWWQHAFRLACRSALRDLRVRGGM